MIATSLVIVIIMAGWTFWNRTEFILIAVREFSGPKEEIRIMIWPFFAIIGVALAIIKALT